MKVIPTLFLSFRSKARNLCPKGNNSNAKEILRLKPQKDPSLAFRMTIEGYSNTVSVILNSWLCHSEAKRGIFARRATHMSSKSSSSAKPQKDPSLSFRMTVGGVFRMTIEGYSNTVSVIPKQSEESLPEGQQQQCKGNSSAKASERSFTIVQDDNWGLFRITIGGCS